MADHPTTGHGVAAPENKDPNFIVNSSETPLAGAPPNYHACAPESPPGYHANIPASNYQPPYGQPPNVQPGYPPQPMPHGQVGYPAPVQLVVGQVAPRFREVPLTITCQHCNANVTTTMQYDNGTFTWLMAGIICFFGGFLGCCLIPFCVSACKEVIHTCPNCNRMVGRYTRM